MGTGARVFSTSSASSMCPAGRSTESSSSSNCGCRVQQCQRANRFALRAILNASASVRATKSRALLPEQKPNTHSITERPCSRSMPHRDTHAVHIQCRCHAGGPDAPASDRQGAPHAGSEAERCPGTRACCARHRPHTSFWPPLLIWTRERAYHGLGARPDTRPPDALQLKSLALCPFPVQSL